MKVYIRNMSKKYDLIVIGSGPGGYVAAIRAAQLGMSVACVEKDSTLGGTCLNVGCIPSKALLHSSEYFHKFQTEGKEHGIECSDLKVNLAQMMKRKEGVVKGFTQGIEYLFKKNKITWIKGEAKLTSGTTVDVGGESYEASHILLATGSESIPLPFLPFDEKVVVSSTGALSLSKVPKKLLLVGAGVIGLELGSVYRRLGAEVTVIELLDRVCPMFDREISKTIFNIFKKQGMEFHLSAKVKAGSQKNGSVSLSVETTEGEKTFDGDVALVGIGRRPYVRGLGLEELGIALDGRGGVKIDANFRTSIPTVYAIGDLVDGPMLAHKASEEGIAAVEMIAGRPAHINYLAIPNVMYTWPEVACVGMSEEDAAEAGIEVIKGTFPFKANSRARCSGDDDGLVKIIGEKNSDRLIGMHIVGPNASEMIGEGVVALEKKMTVHELAYASHAHPTCSEAIKEAALAVHKQALHV